MLTFELVVTTTSLPFGAQAAYSSFLLRTGRLVVSLALLLSQNLAIKRHHVSKAHFKGLSLRGVLHGVVGVSHKLHKCACGMCSISMWLVSKRSVSS